MRYTPPNVLLALVLATAGCSSDSSSEAPDGGGVTDASPLDGPATDGGAADGGEPCPLPAAGSELSAKSYSAPPECALSPASLPVTITVIDGEQAYHDVFNCTPVDTAAGIDFTKERIAIVFVPENPNAALAWVHEGDAVITVGVWVQAYCGGARPPDSFVAARVPAGPKTLEQQICNVGDCPGCPPNCPP